MLATAFLMGSSPDEEEFRFAILSSWLHARALAQGTYMFWTPALGLGVPHPLVPNFLLHPLLPLLGVVSPVTWVRLLLLLHTVLGATGMWEIGRTLQLKPLTRAVCVFTFVLSAPSENYILSDFWPSHYVAWTSAPWLQLIAWRVLEKDAGHLRRWSVLLGLCVGLVVANSNPGHVTVYAAAVVAVAAAHWRTVIERWRWLLVAGLIAVAISGPNLAQLATELKFFATDLGRSNLPEPLPLSAAWDVFFRPLSRSQDSWQVDTVTYGTRTLFFGGPFAVLCLLGCFRFGSTRRDLALGVTVSTVLLFTSILPMPYVSARYQFRDPLVLFAIPMAGLGADRVLRSQRSRPVALLLVVLQLGVVTLSAWPFLKGTWQPDALRAMWFRGATGDTPLVDTLVKLMPSSGRLLYSPQVDHEISERAGVREGLGVNALAYRGVSVVNGWFKGVAADSLWPSDRLFYGRIRTPQGLVESDEALDVLSIRYVLANRGEPVARGLRERGSVAKMDGSHLVLYENPDPWPGAFLVDRTAQDLELPIYAGCGHDRLLCRDLAPLARRRQPSDLEMTRRGGHIRIKLTPVDEPRLLLVAEMFRPDWVASSEARRVPTISLCGGLLGVTLPPRATSVRLDYRPLAPLAAAALAWCALLGSLIALGAETISNLRRPTSPKERPVP